MKTFFLPEIVVGSKAEVNLARDMLHVWRTDGIFQVFIDREQGEKTAKAMKAGRHFFAKPPEFKRRHVSDLTYSGYIASGEEITGQEKDHPEIFTICPDIPADDWRVEQQWPCHGPVPWPDKNYQINMLALMAMLGEIGDKILRLVALGLGQKIDALTSLTQDGWHHLRVLRFPAATTDSAKGIGAHTDYGLLVIAAQDDVGGLYIRPPVAGEKRYRNWLPNESMAGRYENEEPWVFVRPQPNVLTVFPGDIMQFLTGGDLLSTPHKVKLNNRERFALAYFHEPHFQARIRPLNHADSSDYLHYGEHFSQMFMRSYPERVTTKRMLEEQRLAQLT